ncbi:hypothetical protein MMC19_005877 [Ptychographa xylographoides]|nr:hypothetical protein [Ptychographa xylographoides]
MNAQLQRRCQSILEPNMTLQEYVKPITSRSCQWITFLSLSHLTCSRSDLINISKLTNIGILTIGRGVEASANGLDDSIDNSIFRAWSRAAKETGAFSRLRVLVCRSQRDITFQALDYLSQIPTLTHFLLEHCPLGPKDILFAQKLGWKYRAGTGLIGFLAESGTTKRSWDETMHACWREAVGSVNITGESLPILHLAIGSPLDDVVVDVTGKPILRCFYRDVATARVPAKSVVPPRRPLADPFPPQSVPKRIMKVRNQQSLGSALSEFWV